MNSARALSDAAIGRLPVINSTIQSANRDNAVTSSLIKGVSEGYQQALETVSQLQEAVNRLQVNTAWKTYKMQWGRQSTSVCDCSPPSHTYTILSRACFPCPLIYSLTK